MQSRLYNTITYNLACLKQIGVMSSRKMQECHCRETTDLLWQVGGWGDIGNGRCGTDLWPLIEIWGGGGSRSGRRGWTRHYKSMESARCPWPRAGTEQRTKLDGPHMDKDTEGMLGRTNGSEVPLTSYAFKYNHTTLFYILALRL